VRKIVKTYISIDDARRDAAHGEVVKQMVNFDCVAVEALIHVRGLHKVGNVGQVVWVLVRKRSRNAAVRDADATERDLAEVALGGRRSRDCEEVLAKES
jgi:hypothetical protein